MYEINTKYNISMSKWDTKSCDCITVYPGWECVMCAEMCIFMTITQLVYRGKEPKVIVLNTKKQIIEESVSFIFVQFLLHLYV